MVLMKAEDKQRLEQMRQQCGQERDLQIKQVENGFIIQAVTRFFVDQGSGPVQAGEMSDTTIAVTAYEAGTIAANYMRHGEFWPDGMAADDDDVTGADPVLDAIMPEQRAQYGGYPPDIQPGEFGTSADAEPDALAGTDYRGPKAVRETD